MIRYKFEIKWTEGEDSVALLIVFDRVHGKSIAVIPFETNEDLKSFMDNSMQFWTSNTTETNPDA